MQKGSIEIINDFPIKSLNRSRTLRIYLPKNYSKSSKRYPVLYMHDAQNLFDPSLSTFGEIWDVANSLDLLSNENEAFEIIVVGIDNGGINRFNEYSPWKSEIIHQFIQHVPSPHHSGGEGFQYIDFLVHELKPYIDNHYRTLTDVNNTSIAGSSMGGFISLSAGIKYPDVFSKIGAFSTAVFFEESKLFNFIATSPVNPSQKIYMDIGTNETSNPHLSSFPQIYLDSNNRLYDLLKGKGYLNITYIIDQGAAHNEPAWKKRFPDAIRFLYSK